jgi:hypothetical protein
MTISRVKFTVCRLMVAVAMPGVIFFSPAASGSDKTPETASFILGINRDKSLPLDGKDISREELTKEWARLASQLRAEAKIAGKPIDSKGPLPAVIAIWAADETPYSVIYSLSWDAQKSGFQQWVFAPKSLYPDPTVIARPTQIARKSEASDLPAELRTIPILLRAEKDGKLGQLTLGEIDLKDFEALRLELRKIQDDPDTPFDRALLKIESNLAFSELERFPFLCS